jgi:iron complex transport system ATP-binding protein
MTAASHAAAAASTDLALRTIDLSVGYRSRRARRALQHLDVSVRPGELVCLLGPNGIGKSTLLRTLARMQPAMSGSIELGGCDLGRLHQMDLARRLGIVLTEQLSVSALTAVHVVELGRYPHCGWFGRLSWRDRAVVGWAIDAVGAQPLAGRDSQAVGRRATTIMIARALAQEPSCCCSTSDCISTCRRGWSYGTAAVARARRAAGRRRLDA